MTARFALGIDLGTTNSTLASLSLDDDAADAPVALAIPQVVGRGEVASEPRLPSFLHVPAAAELGQGTLDVPWASGATDCVGRFAQTRGSEVPGRVVSSAKSWLCHGGVDRHGPILPPDAPDDVEKLSPVAVSARYLSHLAAAWDDANPDAPFLEQDVIVTVPASFDAVARQLTEEAAAQAGLREHVTLLEEPQAALYAWVADKGERWREHLTVGDCILVCDVGGGTTDFSLISVSEEDGRLQLDRVAVGEHILLGGDNMDLALAWSVKAAIETKGKSLDDWQLRGLVHGCRAGKEAMLEDLTLTSWPLVVPSRGRKLIGGSIKGELSRETLDKVVQEGFLPQVDAAARPVVPRRAGLTTLGLPFASDAAITRHLAAFLGANATGGKALAHPTAILFNGGVTRAGSVRARLRSMVDEWVTADGGASVSVLPGSDSESACSRGAAYYGRVRTGRGVRIRGGTGRAYYVGIERTELAIPGVPPRLDAVCIAPLGMEEGSEANLDDELGLVIGEPAAFRFFASANRKGDAVADKVAALGELSELPPIETTLQDDDGARSGEVVPVRLSSRVTEVGTLELSAIEAGTGKRWRLSFDVRGQSDAGGASGG